jgi:hypothetical protein
VTTALGAIACLLAAAAGVAGHRSPREEEPSRSTTRAVVLLVLAAASATSAVAVEFAPGPVRVPVVLAAVLLAPGFAITAGRRIDGALDELAVALGAGVALLILVATAMAVTALWLPETVGALASLVVAPVLAWHGARGLRAHRPVDEELSRG